MPGISKQQQKAKVAKAVTAKRKVTDEEGRESRR